MLWVAVPALAALATACAASGREDETAIDLLVGHEAGRAVVAEPAARRFDDSAGRAIVLERGIVAIESVELVPCAGTISRLLRLLSPVGVARAHGVGSDRKLAEPHLQSVLDPDGAHALVGTVHPLPGRYCQVRVVFGPADADAEGAATMGMVGKTIDLHVTIDSGSGPVSAHVESDAEISVDVPIQEVDLARDQIAERTFTLRYGAWLDGIDPVAPDAAIQVLARIAQSTLSP